MEALPKALQGENRLNLLQNLAGCTCGCMSNQLMQGCPGNRNVENEPFSTAERSERVENFLFRATRGYTEAGIKQAIVAMRRLGANSPEPRKRVVRA